VEYPAQGVTAEGRLQSQGRVVDFLLGHIREQHDAVPLFKRVEIRLAAKATGQEFTLAARL
jgi:hypothetical protein